MTFFSLLVAISSLLASAKAQSCARITESDLGNTNTSSTDGLIADILGINSANSGDTPVTPLVLLQRFRIVCEAVGVNVDTYRFVSLVAEYTVLGSPLTISQFEFACAGPDLWNVEVSGSKSETVTTPSDATFSTPLRSDCSQCLSPSRRGSSGTIPNHCSACSDVCEGLNQCTSIFTCCNYYEDGMCVTACSSPRIVQPDNNTCVCAPGFTGQQCDTTINFCAPDPCMNSGNCSSSSSGFSCMCPDGFEGDRCETMVDPCGNNPCMNSGTCSSSSSGISCVCPDDYEGDRCETMVDPCGNNPCMSGSTCVRNSSDFTCLCPTGFTGNLCQDDIDQQTCEQVCMNGFCLQGNCVCEDGFVGSNCETQCTLNFCEQCFLNSSGCERCENGFISDLNNLCTRDTSLQINLTDIELIAIVVGCMIFVIMIAIILTCIIACLFKIPCRRRPRKTRERKYGQKHTKTRTETKQMTLINGEVVMENGYAEEMEDKDAGTLTMF